MIEIKKIFSEIDVSNAFKKLSENDCPLGIYVGMRNGGMPSLAFMSKQPPLILESTQCLKVNQWKERESVYWTSFDLKLENARSIFYALCSDLIEVASRTTLELHAMHAIKNRYMIWRKMFKKTSNRMTEEMYKGLFGELYFFYMVMRPKIGIPKAIRAWSGPNMTAKDFSYNEEWYEVKTITINTNEVRITSIAQLDSNVPGHLVVLRVEQMSEEYDDGKCTVEQLVAELMKSIRDDKDRELFTGKLMAYGYEIDENECIGRRYRVANKGMYLIDEHFPRLTEKKIPHEEIIKLSYTLSLDGIKKFREEMDDFN